PVAVIVEAARLFGHARKFNAAGTHELDVGLGGFVTIVERTLLPGLSPEHFVVAVGVKRRVDVDEVDGVVGELLELLQVVATVDDARVEQGEGLGMGFRAQRSGTDDYNMTGGSGSGGGGSRAAPIPTLSQKRRRDGAPTFLWCERRADPSATPRDDKPNVGLRL